MFISGATGVHAAAINGFFEPTQEMGLDGRLILTKRGDAGMVMEHFGGRWQVKLVSDKGKDIRFASVEGGCALAACTSRPWRLSSDGTPQRLGNMFSDAPGVKIVLEAEVSSRLPLFCGFFTRARPHCFPLHRLLKAKPRLLLKPKPLLKPPKKPNTCAPSACWSSWAFTTTCPPSCEPPLPCPAPP